MGQKISMTFKGNCPTIRIYGCGWNVVVSLNIVEIGKKERQLTRNHPEKYIYKYIYFCKFLTHNPIKLKKYEITF